MTFDPTKLVPDANGHLWAQTRDGRRVRVLCTDRKGHEPIVGLCADAYGGETVLAWKANGDFNGFKACDLINPPVKRRGWVVLGIPSNGRPFVRADLYENYREAEKCLKTYAIPSVIVQLPEWSEP